MRLIALQGLEDATERRKHAVKRGRVALDALDELKIGLLGGTLSQATMGKLRSAAAFLKDGSGDAGLRLPARRDRASGRGRDRQDGRAAA